MVEPFELEKKQEQEVNEKEHKAALGILAQLVRYVPMGISLSIFGSFIFNQDWQAAVITFPIMVIMIAWSAYSQDFLLQIQKRMELLGKEGALSLIQRVQKLDFFNFRANSNIETADLNGADLRGIDLSGVDLRYANLRGANLSGANLSGANLRYADLRYADFRYTNLSEANLKYANLSDANLYCTLLNGANLSDANLSGALLFFVNLREVLNLEPLQLKAKPLPFLCNVALPSYSQQTNLNPNRACNQVPQLLRDRYDISLEEAQLIVDEVLQHHWG